MRPAKLIRLIITSKPTYSQMKFPFKENGLTDYTEPSCSSWTDTLNGEGKLLTHSLYLDDNVLVISKNGTKALRFPICDDLHV